ncbi:hypothetical protein niasHS_008532 [Heterodera schachtii]|uniref:Uncharacterized protein n=1 Tax=Heterodera schachtii TaxID=97005 RepID=A0ABD2IWA8_HETSC
MAQKYEEIAGAVILEPSAEDLTTKIDNFLDQIRFREFWNGADEDERLFEYAQELKPKGTDADWKPSLGALLNLQPLSEQQGGMDTPIEGVTSIYVYLRRAGAFFAPHTENAELFSISLLTAIAWNVGPLSSAPYGLDSKPGCSDYYYPVIGTLELIKKYVLQQTETNGNEEIAANKWNEMTSEITKYQKGFDGIYPFGRPSSSTERDVIPLKYIQIDGHWFCAENFIKKILEYKKESDIDVVLVSVR